MYIVYVNIIFKIQLYSNTYILLPITKYNESIHRLWLKKNYYYFLVIKVIYLIKDIFHEFLSWSLEPQTIENYTIENIIFNISNVFLIVNISMSL